LQEEFAGKPTSIAFPTLSPDLNRVFFKVSAGNGGDNFTSHRQGIVFYDFRKRQLTWQRGKWGHPAWHPDSQHFIEMGNLLFDADGAPYTRIPNVPVLRGMHPSVSPDGKLWVTDGLADNVSGTAGQWAVMIADFEGKNYEVLHRFLNAPGARSWRVNHPHPIVRAPQQNPLQRFPLPRRHRNPKYSPTHNSLLVQRRVTMRLCQCSHLQQGFQLTCTRINHAARFDPV